MNKKPVMIKDELKYIMITAIAFFLMAAIGELIMIIIHDTYPMALFFATMGFTIIAGRAFKLRKHVISNE